MSIDLFQRITLWGIASLIFATATGPAKFTEYVRSLGDPVTRLDRVEPS